MRAFLVLAVLMPFVVACPASAAVSTSNSVRADDSNNARSPLRFVDGTPRPANQPMVVRDARRPIRLDHASDHTVTLSWDRAALRDRWLARTRFVVERLPLVGGRTVDLELHPFAVTGPDTKFVVGRKGGPDVQLDFDPASVLLFRGKVMDRPGSHVFLALSDSRSTGYVDLGHGDGRYRISSRGADGEPLSRGAISIYEPFGPASAPPDVPLCGVTDTGGVRHPAGGVAGETDFSIKHLELAVETDFEFYVLFRDLDDAAAYLVTMYGAVSDVYLRDVDTHIELVFARLWDTPDDLFNDVDPSPLPEFRQYWNENMGAVHRDLAQLLSGRRDYLFGGQAFLSSLCGGNAYSVVGYAAGFFPDPTTPSPYTYDVMVTAHEIGHNAGTSHTHNAGIDTCQDPTTIPQRGTIMSYCSQTWSGQASNVDTYFHTTIVGFMRDHITSVECVATDCNLNFVDDLLDIANGDSADTNGNNVPDECEDCNGNKVLDPTDILDGTSTDLNGNSIPDECEADCNGNSVPDDYDIAVAASEDAYGNGVPDECETDCDNSGVSDYTQIQLDMTLDVDRNALLDACQDCDGDGMTDHEEMAGGHNIWIASGLQARPLLEFYADTGVEIGSSQGVGAALVNEGQDLIITPNRRILVSSGTDNRVMEFDSGGVYIGDFVPAGVGGLNFPTGLLSLPEGRILVVSRDGNSVLAYDAADGTPLGEFVAAGSGGLVNPFGITRAPNGSVMVTSGANEVLEYDGTDGAFIRIFVTADDNGGLDQPRGIAFKPDGNLLVASFGTNQTLEFDGLTGEALGRWALFGTATVLTQSSPWGIRIAPTGNVFVVRTGEDFGSGGGGGHDDDHEDTDIIDDEADELHLTNAQIYEFDARNGNFIRVHIGGNDHTLEFPTGFDFMPGWDLDCNLNLLPDDCDIASGTSVDDDGSGVPDECEIDCNTNGVFDRFDIIPFGASRDCNANMIPDECDLASAFSLDDNENGIPDECDIDCNANLVPDDLDILNGTSMDCDANGVPDECDPDCNDNDVPDACDISGGTSEDCDANGVPDECDPDCNNNGVADACDISDGTSEDCNGSGVPDECELQNADCNDNMIPDECDPDCDADGIPNDCDGEVLFHDDFEQDLGWTTVNLGATSGDWERGVPVNDPNWNHDPFSDSDGSGQCYLTENAFGNTDVDGGAVALISPIIDMSIGGITIQYDFFLKLTEDNQGTDWLRVEINSTGGVGDWIQIALHDTNGGLTWRTNTITPEDLDALGVETTNSMVLRFIANDGNPQSVVEAALDAFFVLTALLDCNDTGVPDTCEMIANGDYDGDGAVTLADWTAFAVCMAGPNVPPTHPITQCVDVCLAAFDADLDGDVDVRDFATFMTVFDAP